MTNDDMDAVVPLGQADDFTVASDDPDVRGWEVLGSDGARIGEVDELLVDTAAMKVRYLDVDVDDAVIGDGRDRHVLIPIGYARLDRDRDCVTVDGLASTDLRTLPAYDQGPLTRDFESSVRESFSTRRATTTADAGMVDTAGLDNTPGTGTALGLGTPATGEGMRAAGYDVESGASGSLHEGAGDDRTLVGGSAAGAADETIVRGTGTDRAPRGDVSHRAATGDAGSDYMHNADEDFYASDAFDDSRFYGARRTGAGDADRDETSRLAREASERLREDHINRDVGGTGTR